MSLIAPSIMRSEAPSQTFHTNCQSGLGLGKLLLGELLRRERERDRERKRERERERERALGDRVETRARKAGDSMAIDAPPIAS